MNTKDIKQRFEALFSDRQIVQEVWDLIEKYIVPFGGGRFFQPLHNEGEIDWRRRDIFDDTAILGCDTLAASIHGSLTSPATKWFDLNFRNKKLNDNIEAKQWLDEASRIAWDTIQDSNFNLEIAEGYLDLCGFGNTAISHEPINDLKWEGMEFDAMPLREIYFEEDANGKILRLFRLFQWRPAAIVSKFGAEKVPEKIVNKADATPVSERVDVIFCIYPREENKDADTSTILTKEKRPYGYKYILRESGEMLGDEGGYYEMPAYAVRWRRTSGSQWGYGPGHIAISTVLTLNETIKLVLEAAEKVIDPASLVTRRGVLSDLDLSPGGMTVVKDKDAIVPYESRARFDVSAVNIADLRDMVRRLFHVDQLELKESPAMSATEVMVRYELMNRLLGPTMGRLQHDLLDPLVTNTVAMLYRAKEIPEMPQIVRDAGGIVNIEYVGPLSRAQKMDENASLERWLGNISGLAEIFPEIRNVPNAIAIGKFMADGLNVDSNLMNSDGVINQLQAKDKQIEQLMGQLEVAQQQADIDKTNSQAGGLQAVQ